MSKIIVGITTFNNMDCMEKITQMMCNSFVYVCDDCSTDGTYEILKEKFGDRVLKTEKNTGNPSVARNLIITNFAKGYKYLTFCDGDDFLDLKILKKAVKGFRHYDLIITSLISCFDHGNFILEKDNMKPLIGTYNSIPHSRILNLSGGRIYSVERVLNSKIEYKNFPGQDTVFNYEFCENANKICVKNIAFYNRIIGEVTLSTSTDVGKYSKRLNAFIELCRYGRQDAYLNSKVVLPSNTYVERHILLEYFKKNFYKRYGKEVIIDEAINYENVKYFPTKFETIDFKNRENGLTIIQIKNKSNCYNIGAIEIIDTLKNNVIEAMKSAKNKNIIFLDDNVITFELDKLNSAFDMHVATNNVLTYFDVKHIISGDEFHLHLEKITFTNVAPIIVNLEEITGIEYSNNINFNRDAIIEKTIFGNMKFGKYEDTILEIGSYNDKIPPINFTGTFNAYIHDSKLVKKSRIKINNGEICYQD